MSWTFSAIAYSDLDPVMERRAQWGDYWFKHHLTEALVDAGGIPVSGTADVLLHLFGSPAHDLPPAHLKILWIHSHPDWIQRRVLERYDVILCTSKPFTRRLVMEGWKARWLMVPTHMKPMESTIEYPVVFVGNNRRNHLRKAVGFLLDAKDRIDFPLAIWGEGWEGLLNPSWYRGRCVPNEYLNGLYASAALVLNDHHEDMAREGFLNPRILDGTASGSLVLTDPVLGMDDLVSLPHYTDAHELLDLMTFFLGHPDERASLQATAHQCLAEFTYDRSARYIVEQIHSRLG